MNVIAELGKHHKITQVQTRLIALEMEKTVDKRCIRDRSAPTGDFVY